MELTSRLHQPPRLACLRKRTTITLMLSAPLREQGVGGWGVLFSSPMWCARGRARGRGLERTGWGRTAECSRAES